MKETVVTDAPTGSFLILVLYSSHSLSESKEEETKKERKPFNLEEELKKPYIVGIKAE